MKDERKSEQGIKLAIVAVIAIIIAATIVEITPNKNSISDSTESSFISAYDSLIQRIDSIEGATPLPIIIVDGMLCDTAGTVWENSIYNPDNVPYVLEVAFNLDIPIKSVTQQRFNERYLK